MREVSWPESRVNNVRLESCKIVVMTAHNPITLIRSAPSPGELVADQCPGHAAALLDVSLNTRLSLINLPQQSHPLSVNSNTVLFLLLDIVIICCEGSSAMISHVDNV